LKFYQANLHQVLWRQKTISLKVKGRKWRYGQEVSTLKTSS
jgi:hypothetical protein